MIEEFFNPSLPPQRRNMSGSRRGDFDNCWPSRGTEANPGSSSGKSATNQAIEVQAGHPGGSAVFKLFATQPCCYRAKGSLPGQVRI